MKSSKPKNDIIQKTMPLPAFAVPQLDNENKRSLQTQQQPPFTDPRIENEVYKRLQFLFSDGKWSPSHDALVAGSGNFSDMQNLRFGERCLEGVPGYSKINTTALETYLKIRSGIHLQSPFSGASRVLVQAYNSGLAASQVLENDADVPAQGDFEATALHTDDASAGLGRFSKWPNNHIAYCNGKETKIYGGSEIPCAGFMTSTAEVTGAILTNPRDYTEEVKNALQTAAHVAVIGGGIDSYTVLMLHCDGSDGSTTFPDSSGTGKTIAAGGNACIDTDYPGFGTGSAIFDGTGDYLNVTDHADFVFGTDPFTIDFLIRFNTLPGIGESIGLFGQAQNNENWILCAIHRTESGYGIDLSIDVAGSVTTVIGANLTIDLQIDTKYHFAIIRGWGGNANDWMLTIDGDPAIGTVTKSVTMPDINANVLIARTDGAGVTYYFNGWIDEFRISKGIARWTEQFSPPARAYSTAARTFLVFSTRPVQGGKFYIPAGRGNTTVSTLTMKEWNGASWEPVTISDGTSSGGCALTQTGTWTCSSRAETSVLKYIEGRALYVYQFTLSDGEADIYRCTVNCPWQDVRDCWDGTSLIIPSVLVYNATETAYKDYTLYASEESESTVVDLDSLDTTEHLLIGSVVPLMGFYIGMVSDSTKVNDNAAVMSVAYCDGGPIASWPTVSSLSDGTSNGTKSLHQPGTISFTPVTPGQEFKISINGGIPLYHYKVTFSAQLSADVEAYLISGIAAPKPIMPYKFPFMFLGRPMLCGDLSGGEGNRVDYGLTGSTDVWNGPDSSRGVESEPLYFGGAEELTAACEVFNRLGSSIYAFGVFTKDYETYILNGYDEDTYKIYPISPVYGCPAPLTMDTWQIGISADRQSILSIAMWLSYDGPVIFDSAGLQLVPGLECYFDRRDSRCINHSAIEGARGWFDDDGDYNLQFPSGSGQTTNNIWVVLNMKTMKWYPVVPSASSPYLGAAFPVFDSSGKRYVYGARDNGYMMRLHDPSTPQWDGSDSVQSVTLSDMVPDGDVWNVTMLRRLKLFGISISEDVDASVTHYADGSTVETALASVELNTSARYFKNTQALDLTAWSHKIKISGTFSTEAKGMRLLGIGLEYKKIRDDY